MIGDKLVIKDYHRISAKMVYEHLLKATPDYPFSISVAGESGSGKSEIAVCIKELIEAEGKNAIILGQDDYFRLPPHSNHKQRKADISWVGPQEVQLDLLDLHVQKLQSAIEVVKPLVHFEENFIDTESITGPFDVVLAEGTYTSLLKNITCRAFINRNYKETKKDRLARNRDQALENGQDQELTFLEEVLEIEHKEISQHKRNADVIIPPPA